LSKIRIRGSGFLQNDTDPEHSNTVFFSLKERNYPVIAVVGKWEKIGQNFRTADRGKDPRIYLVSFLDKFVELGLEDTLQFVHDVG
jgi:hypothetical protein